MLIVRILPQGLRGLLVAVAIATLTSSLTSIFNSVSTIITLDLWRFIRKKAGHIELLIVGRYENRSL